jgi:uncharacterized protein (TIGR02172 family)
MNAQLLALGRTAELFEWQPGQVLKLFMDWCPREWADWEARITRTVHDFGLPVPAVIDIVEQAGRRGIIFERITGSSMLQVIQTQPWRLFSLARRLAELHAAMHTQTMPDLPSYRASLQQRIRAAAVSDAAKASALRQIDQLPDGEAVCHGDFHPGNVILSPRGPIIIDWIAAMQGQPLADVARTSLLLSIGEPPPNAKGRYVLTLGRALLHAVYLRRYVQLRQVTRAEVEAWRLPTVIARTREDIPNERHKLAALIESLTPPA